MRINKSLLAALAATLTLGSCTDFINGFDEKAHEYQKNYVEQFGEIDPNQDWSMAATVSANVSVGSNPNVVIYSNKPGHPNSKIVGIVNGKSSVFNMVKGTEQVYAIARENGKKLVSGYFDVVNGVVNINNAPVNKKEMATRDASGPTRAQEPLFAHVAYDAEPVWDNKTYYTEQWETIDGTPVKVTHLFYIAKEEGSYYLYWSKDINSKPIRLKHNYSEGKYDGVGLDGLYSSNVPLYYDDGDNDDTNDEVAIQNGLYIPNYVALKEGEPVINENQWQYNHYVTRPSYAANYYTISDTKTTDVTWTIKDCKNLFWEGDAFFRESEDYRSDRKKALYEGQGVSLTQMEKGVIYTTSKNDDEITIPMMFGATEYQNVLGYYYYTDGQDDREVNRYILYDDAQPTTNIKVDGNNLTSGMDMQQMQSGWTDESEVTCTARRLVYFGPDGNGEGTFKFPKDVHIGFFIMRQSSLSTGGKENFGQGANGWTYSDPNLNKKYFNNEFGNNGTLVQYWGYRNSGSNQVGTASKGNVKAITWNYNGRILVGFGDDSGDHDLNDFVFWVDGEFKEEPPIHITTKEDVQSWNFACEDLGGSDDYDFNDVVWEVAQDVKVETSDEPGTEPVYTYGNVNIFLLAAGGILPVDIIYGNENLGEIHHLFGQGDATEYDPVNVKSSRITKPVVKLKSITASSAININEIKQNFKLIVHGKSGNTEGDKDSYVLEPSSSTTDAPQMLILPGDWEWPKERVSIKTAYKDFTRWNTESWQDWLETKQPDTTVGR